MSEAADLAQAHYRAFNDRDFRNVSRTHSPDLVSTDPTGTSTGIDAYLAHTHGFLTAFPDARVETYAVIDGGDRAVIQGAFVGTHTGPLVGPDGEVPPTGRSLTMPICHVFEAEAGRIARHAVYYDQMGFLAQLGLLPESADA